MALESNRREAVRVMDRVLISFDSIAKDEFQAILEDYERGILPSRREGAYEIEAFIGTQNALQRMREREEDLADFLQHLDTKINMLLSKLQGQPSPMDGLTLIEVSLSGTGISLTLDRSYKLNDIFALNIVLLPNYAYIHCFGRVVGCDEQKGRLEADKSSYRVALEFALIMEDDREKLMQHSFKLQSMFLRNRRQID
ncbi:MAG: hypothetical protein A2511_12155 [Deltaproteobacteria bacterium RIFOXYD12_FULL_50_9]|nr:MAG: hypothetical protein A2511_12155 [Deltaproteobacteria bacterium RIFOXYD12_FULL_50_9]